MVMGWWLLLLLAISGVHSLPRQPRLREFPLAWRQQYARTIASSVLSRVPPGARLIGARGDLPPLISRLVHNASTIRHHIVDTFTCQDRVYGYYADQDNDCQIFHICVPMQQLFPDLYTALDIFHFSFICPGYTIFSQDAMVCAWEDTAFPCSEAHQLYHRNNHFFVVPAEDVQKTTTTSATSSTPSTTSFFHHSGVRSNHRHDRYRNTFTTYSTSNTSPSPVNSISPFPSTLSIPSTSPSTLISPSTSPSTLISPSTSSSTLVSPSTSPSTLISPSTSPSTLSSPSTYPSTLSSPSISLSPVHSPSPSSSPVSNPTPSPNQVSGPSPSPSPVSSPDPFLSTVSSPSTAFSPTRSTRPGRWSNYRHKYRLTSSQRSGIRSSYINRLRASAPSSTSPFPSTTLGEEADTFSPTMPLYQL